MQPHSIVSCISAPRIRVLSLRGALGPSYCLRVYFWKLHYALRMHCAPVDLDGHAAIVIDVPPDVYELVRLAVHMADYL